MLNQIILVGRITQDLEKKELENGKRYCQVTLAIPRSWKNAQGEYETDFIDCIIYDTICDNVVEYCKTGDLAGIKGRVQSSKIGDKNHIEVIAEKVTFLSSRKAEDDGE